MNKLSIEESDRYYCSISLKEIGIEGQEKLKASKVLVVGSGGLASSALLYLSSSGVGTIGIIDNDKVSLNNLPRQILFDENDIGEYKAEAAKKKLEALNKNVSINIYKYRLNKDNAEEVISKYDIILDCVDNFESKFLINDTCVKLQKPFVTAGVSDYKGQIMTYVSGKGKDFKSIFDELPINIDPKYIDDDAVFPTAVGVVSNIQVSEALKYLLNIGDLLINKMLVVDLLKWDFRKIEIK